MLAKGSLPGSKKKDHLKSQECNVNCFKDNRSDEPKGWRNSLGSNPTGECLYLEKENYVWVICSFKRQKWIHVIICWHSRFKIH